MPTSTPEAIRDRMIAVIEALTPTSDVRVPYRRYRNEGGANFQGWAEKNPTAARRRFQVRTAGRTTTPAVSNTDIEQHEVEVTITLAYPQTGRDGPDQALDRDDTADVDQFQIDRACGMLGKANFFSPYPDATWIEGVPGERIEGETCDFIELRYVMIYFRARALPIAAFTVSGTFLDLEFASTSSSPSGDTIISWLWNFGDDETSVSENPTHSFAAGGNYTVTLTVRDNNGQTGTTAEEIEVEPPALIAWLGQSNCGDNTDYEQGDSGLLLGLTYANVFITSKYGISDPIVWNVDRARETLRPSAAGGSPNMGATLAGGRLLYERTAVTEIVQFAVSSTEVSEWLPGSGLPANPVGADDLYDQSVDYIRAAEAASGTTLTGIIWIQGENDAIAANDAAAYQSRLTTLMTAYRAEFSADLPVVIVRLNSSAAADYVTEVRAAQTAFVAADAGRSALVNVDDLPLIDAFHYGPAAITTLGNRCASKMLDLLDYPARAVEGDAPIFVGAEPGVSGAGALTPRSRPDLVAGDVEVLITSAGYLSAADSLTTAQGFVLAEEGTSIWTVVNSNARMYTRTVTQVALDANGGIMPSPVVADSNDLNAAKIYAFRGPNGTLTIGDTAVSVNNAADAAMSCPGVTTAANNALVVNFSTGWAGSTSRTLSGATNASLSGFSSVQPSVFAVSGEGVVMSMLTGVDAALGSVSASTGTYDLYVVQVNFTISLEP